ncbi:hypothetical protein TNCV_1701731 [Trichonephila clavipes]|nr:hypothetical protein TNCV_1701731 [Trichonephila clavipes]
MAQNKIIKFERGVKYRTIEAPWQEAREKMTRAMVTIPKTGTTGSFLHFSRSRPLSFSPSHSITKTVHSSALFSVYRALGAKPPSTLCAKPLQWQNCSPHKGAWVSRKFDFNTHRTLALSKEKKLQCPEDRKPNRKQQCDIQSKEDKLISGSPHPHGQLTKTSSVEDVNRAI